MMNKSRLIAAVLMFAGFALQAQAAPIVVDAFANSSSGGTGANAGSVNIGDTIVVTVASTDLWSAGALPRWSNANGLAGPLFATGSDESGQAAGVQIGADFGFHTQNGLTARFGALVGSIDLVNFFVIGTSYEGVATSSGVLRLFYWDSNNGDNTGSITANVTMRSTSVPEPSSILLLGLGLLLLAGIARRNGRLN